MEDVVIFGGILCFCFYFGLYSCAWFCWESALILDVDSFRLQMGVELRLTRLVGIIEFVSSIYFDRRGTFLNVFRESNEVFDQFLHGNTISQVNISHTISVGAVRGLHLQRPPHSEAKLVRCLRGRVWDVAVDLRIGSPTYGQWHAVELSPDRANAFLIPEGCAHGFQVLEPNSELLYLHSGHWVPEAETGVRFDDPKLAIEWPLPPAGLSERDLALPLLESLT